MATKRPMAIRPWNSVHFVFQLNFLAVELVTKLSRSLASMVFVRIPLQRLLEHFVRAPFVSVCQHDFSQRNTRFKLSGFKLYGA